MSHSRSPSIGTSASARNLCTCSLRLSGDLGKALSLRERSLAALPWLIAASGEPKHSLSLIHFTLYRFGQEQKHLSLSIMSCGRRPQETCPVSTSAAQNSMSDESLVISRGRPTFAASSRAIQ